MSRPILCLDFDGVLHSYTSGWKGALRIPDPPVEGALEWLVGALDHFTVAILSSRSHRWFGRFAMKGWLRTNLVQLALKYDETPWWWRNRIARTAFADPWGDEVQYAADMVIHEIKWPLHKPPAMVTIDDRALTFTGEWPAYGALAGFKPWRTPV